MSTEQNVALVRRMYAALDNNDLTVVPEIFDPAWNYRDPSLPPLVGHDGARQLITLLKSAFADFRTEIVDIIAEGELVAARLTHTATHTGDFMNIPPTGRQAVITASGIFQVRNGRIVENRVNLDALGLLRQLGVVPEPGAA